MGEPPSAALRVALPENASADGKMPEPTIAPWMPGREAMAAGLKKIMVGSSLRAAAPAKETPWPSALCSRTW
jgi:hypothetical protein